MENNNPTSAPANTQGAAKKSSGLLILTIILGLGTVGFGAAFAMQLFGNSGSGIAADKTDSKCVVTEAEIQAPQQGTVASVVADYDADNYVRGLMREINNAISPFTYDAFGRYDNGVIYYGEENYNAVTSKSYGIVVRDWRTDGGVAAGSTAIDFGRRAIARVLEDNGFTKDEAHSRRAMESDGGVSGYYRKDDFVCEFSGADSLVTIDCASESWFTDADREFVNAIAAISETGASKEMVISGNSNSIIKTNDGKYEVAVVGITGIQVTGGSGAMYYRNTDGGEWTFVTRGNGVPMCSDFEGEAKQAFWGLNYGCAGDDGSYKTVGE